MRLRTVIVAVISLASIGIAIFLLFGMPERAHAPDPGKTVCPADVHVCADGTRVLRSGSACAFAPCPSDVKRDAPPVFWSMSRTMGDDGVPHVALIATLFGMDYPAGEYRGACERLPERSYSHGEVSAMRCWEGNTGVEVGVFTSGDVFVLQRARVEKTSGGSIDRGVFELLTTIERE